MIKKIWIKTCLLDQKKYKKTMKRLEKRLENEKRKSQKLQKELDKFPIKQKEKLEAIRAEGELGNKKAEKQARTNRWNREFK